MSEETKVPVGVYNLVDNMVVAGRLVKEDDEAIYLSNVLDLAFTTSQSTGQYVIIFNKHAFIFKNRVARFPKSMIIDQSFDLIDGFDEFYEAANYYSDEGIRVASLSSLAKELVVEADEIKRFRDKAAVTLDSETVPFDDTEIANLFKEHGNKGGNNNLN